MFQHALKKLAKAFHPSIKSCDNVMITVSDIGNVKEKYSSTKKNNYLNMNTAKKPLNNSPTIEDVAAQQCVIEDKINNLPLSEILYLTFRSNIQIIPELKYNYKTLIIKGYKSKSLGPPMHQMLQQLSNNLINLKLFDCELDFMALCSFLNELPRLETLELSIKLSMDTSIVLKKKLLPKLVHLKELKMELKADSVEELLEIISAASQLEFLTFFDTTFEINHFNYYLKNHKNLKSLSFTKCILDDGIMVSGINSLYLDNIDNLPSMNYKNFDFLEQLETLHLIEVNNQLLNILKSKCIDGLQELKVYYTHEQNKKTFRLIDKWGELKSNDPVHEQMPKKCDEEHLNKGIIHIRLDCIVIKTFQ